MRTIIICFIKIYQLSLGQLFPRVCRFEPTCSNYAIEAITRYGVYRGMLMGLWRIIRCSPLSVGGLDPVPKRSDLKYFVRKIYRQDGLN